MNESTIRNMKRSQNEARAIARKANKNGREISGRDKVRLARTEGSIRKGFVRDTEDA